MTAGPARGPEPELSPSSGAYVIEALEPVRGRLGGFHVRVGGREPFRVPADLIRNRNLELGARLTAKELDATVAEAGEREALDRAVRYLSHRPRTCREVRRRLSERGLSAYAESAIARCVELGYLDDGRYAREFVRERLRLKPRGRVRLVSELLARGVDRAIAERAVEVAMEEAGVTEGSLLRDLAVARARALRRLDPPVARRRLAAFLARRGFPAADVREVVRTLLPEEPGV